MDGFRGSLDSQREQIEAITQEVQQIISRYNENVPNKKINPDNIFIGTCANKPGCVGCYRKDDGWYLYRVDDRFHLLQNGPFSLNGIIVALSHRLYIPAELQSREFDDEEYQLYLNGERPV